MSSSAGIPRRAPRGHRPDSRRRDLRGRRRWPRTAALSLLTTLVLVAAPISLSSGPEPGTPTGSSGVGDLRDEDPAARSGNRADPTPTVTIAPSPTASTTPPVAAPPAATTPPPAAAQLAPPAAPPAAPPPPPPTMSEQIVTLTNAERTAAGLAPFAVSACATEQATARTALLVAEDRFEHDPLEPILQACAARAVGENIALGYPTPTAVVAGWMGSPGHRANILNPAYTQIGVGCTEGPKGALCAQVFVG